MTTHHEITDHEQGTMDVTQQQQTFEGFLKFAGWTVVLSILALIFTALVNS